MTGDDSGDLTGRRLGNYRIDGVLGKGGMSVMYRATDMRLGRKVALKVIGEHLGADAEFRERFVDEARNTSSIDHANVVPLYDFGEIDGLLYIAMRLVDGADLASLIDAGPLAPDRTLRLLDQVADALDSLHHRGLIHLDVKPANVLVTSRESVREQVYLADFGLTRRGATGHRTRGGDFLGSPTYAAPEHLRGEPLDGRTDQYALACVFFVCLTGKAPYVGDVPAVIKGHLTVPPPAVSGIVSVPPALDEVLRKGMAKSPEDRYESCGDLVSAVRRALGPLAMSDHPLVGRNSSAGSAVPTPGMGFPASPPAISQPVETRRIAGSQSLPPRASQQNPPPGQFSGGHQGAQPPGNQAAAVRYGQAQGHTSGPYPMSQPPLGAVGAHPFQPQPTPLGFSPNAQSAGPMRLRPPAPAASSPTFSRGNSGLLRWLWILLGVVVAIGVAILVILLTKNDSSAPAKTPVPEIPVGGVRSSTGSTDAGGTGAGRGGNNPPPLVIPIQPTG